MRKQFEIQACNRILELGSRTWIMGVLNVTPDSFSDGGKFFEPKLAIERAWQIAEEGADILDIGGESTRPGSDGVSASEELDRVMPVLEALARKYPLPISIDTSKVAVARAALAAGAAIINDITALENNEEMGRQIAASNAAIVLMHMRGNPKIMQKLPPSPNILAEIDAWAGTVISEARAFGIADRQMILDPGIGFGKTVEQNLQIIRSLDRLSASGFPVLVGPSRKSFVGKILGDLNADRAWGTAAAVTACILGGAHIVRVHDIAAMRDVVRIADALLAT
jgi:dihydropteroate synthase